MKKSFTQWLKSHNLKTLSLKTLLTAGLFVMFSIAANSQTNYYIRLDSINPKTLKAVKPVVSTAKFWTTDPQGRDSDAVNGGYFAAPKNFTDPNQIFNIQTNGYTNTKAWVISGAGSKLVIGVPDSTIAFTTTNTSSLTATVDVLANSTFTIQVPNTSTINLGNLATGSTVIYNGSTAGGNQMVIPANYYNLSLKSGGATSNPVVFPSSPVGIAGSFITRASSIYGSTIIFNGSGGQAIPAGNYYNLTISGNKSVPDTLKGNVNVAAAFSDVSTGAQTLYYTDLNGTITAASLIYNGLIPQTVVGNKFYNLNFTNGQSFNVSNFNNANNTITLFQANPELTVGMKISANPTNGTVVLDTSTQITAINDTVITLSNAPTIRGYVNHAGHITGAKPDTIYITSYSLTDSSITLTAPDSMLVAGDTLNSQVVATKTLAKTVAGNVVTLSALKSLITGNAGTVTFGSANRKPSDKNLTGDFTIVNTFTPTATGLGTAVLGNVNTSGVQTFSYIGKKQNIAGITYNNLVINQDSATTAQLTGPALVTGTFTLQSGKLNTSNTGNRILTLDVNAQFPPVTNDTFFVTGPLAKNFASTTPFTYQIGAVDKANISYPKTVVITPATADAKTYTATFTRGKVTGGVNAQLDAIADTFAYYNVALSNYSLGADTSAQIAFQFTPTYDIDSSLVLAHYFHGKFVAESPAVLNSNGAITTFTTNGYDTTFGHYTLGVASATYLPVKFGTVSATTVGNSVKVSWESLSEVNVASYVVEGSTDGISFTAKGTVIAKGASDYSFVDADPSAGVNYYRIKEVDNNGAATYSGVVSAKEIATSSLSIYPNPVANKQLNFVVNTGAANYILKVTNILGQSVLTRTVSHNGGTTSYSLSLPANIKAGTYFVKLSNGVTQLNKTIIVE